MKRLAGVLLAVVALGAYAQWVPLDAPPQRGPVAALGTSGEMVIGTHPISLGNALDAQWHAGLADV